MPTVGKIQRNSDHKLLAWFLLELRLKSLYLVPRLGLEPRTN